MAVMPVTMTKYHCVHCQHSFELAAEDFRRCPKCFWTTSLVEDRGARPPQPATPSREAPAIKQSRRTSILKPAFILLVTAAALAALIFYGKAITVKTKQPKPAQGALSRPKQNPAVLLSPDEQTRLVQPAALTIPRSLTQDEDEILKKQVDPPALMANLPPLSLWTKEDFEKLLKAEQAKRKIPLGWSYGRDLKKIFEEHYLQVRPALDQKDYFLARQELIRSLAFPVYQANPVRTRAVVFVMLRVFINDTLGKIAAINQYLAAQSLTAEADAIYKSYQEINAAFDLREWEKGIALIAGLKPRMAAFESKMGPASVDYPPVLRELDAELQAAVQREATPPEGTGVSLRAILVDLGLKESVAGQNTSEALARAQKSYDRALELLKEKNWEAARDELRAIAYPPELVRDVKEKLAILDKILVT